MKIERAILLLIATVLFIISVSGGVSFFVLYNLVLSEEHGHIRNQVRNQVRFIEQVAHFDREYSDDYPGGSRAATISQIRNAFRQQMEGVHTASFMAGMKDGDRIELITPRSSEGKVDAYGMISLPAHAPAVEAMRRALAGESGTLITTGLKGQRVLAGYAPVEALDIGIMAVRDFESLRAPYIRAGGYLGIMALILFLLSGWIVFRAIGPILARERESEARLATILDHMTEAVLVIDHNGIIRFANPAAARLLNREQQSLIDTEFGFTVADDKPSEIVFAGRDRDPGTANMRATDIIWHGQNAKLVALHDVTEYKQLEARLSHDALHDALTGLPNRTLFLERLSIVIEQSRRSSGTPAAVVFVDLDNFKQINDRLSHQVGDALLIEIAGRLKANLRAGDTVARFGGDEFVLLLENLTDRDEGVRVVRRILASFTEPFQLQGYSLHSSASAGMVFLSGEKGTEELLRNADAAMYQAKRQGHGELVIFDKQRHSEANRHYFMESRLRQALENKEFFICYQPIVHLKTERMDGIEALLRWSDGETAVSPEEFIPLLEVTGLILPAGNWVLEESCRQMIEWRTRDEATVPGYVSVNLSTRQLRHTNQCDALTRIIDASGLPPPMIQLEVTESTLMEAHTHVITWLESLRGRGVRICIDDFGTGYASLRYLRDLPIDVLKIDRGFITGIETDCQYRGLVKAVIALAGDLGIKVVAEGVETESGRSVLVELGCEFGQGHLFRRPVSAKMILQILGRSG